MTRTERFIHEIQNTMPNISGTHFKCSDYRDGATKVTLRRQGKILEKMIIPCSAIINAISVQALALYVTRTLCNRYKAQVLCGGLNTGALPRG